MRLVMLEVRSAKKRDEADFVQRNSDTNKNEKDP